MINELEKLLLYFKTSKNNKYFNIIKSSMNEFSEDDPLGIKKYLEVEPVSWLWEKFWNISNVEKFNDKEKILLDILQSSGKIPPFSRDYIINRLLPQLYDAPNSVLQKLKSEPEININEIIPKFNKEDYPNLWLMVNPSEYTELKEKPSEKVRESIFKKRIDVSSAKNKTTPPEVLRDIYNKSIDGYNTSIISYISENPNTPLYILQDIFSRIKSGYLDFYIIAELVKNESLGPLFEEIYNWIIERDDSNDNYLIYRMVANRSIPEKLLMKIKDLAESGGISKNRFENNIANNDRVPQNLLEEILDSENSYAIKSLADNENITSKISQFLVNLDDLDIDYRLAGNIAIDNYTISRLAESEDYNTLVRLLNNPKVKNDSIKKQIKKNMDRELRYSNRYF